MIVITITNEKGGVGKTTISTQLTHYIKKQGKKVVFLDADGQGNGTRFFKPYLSKTTALDFFSKELEQIEDRTLLALPATRGLFALDKLYRNIVVNNVRFLANNGFDYLVIDTSPAMSKCSIACLIVSDKIFSPVNMSDFAFDGVARTVDTIRQVREKNNSHAILAGLIPNLINTKSKVQMRSLAQLLEAQPGRVMPFLALRSPYTDMMNGTMPLCERKPMAGNIKIANHELNKLLSHMMSTVSQDTRVLNGS